MPEKSRSELKKYFKSGSKASQSQYVDLIDSFYGLTGDDSNVLPDILQRTLFVDVNAVAGTGEKGKINNPFDTISSAREFAEEGDTIILFPGTYLTGNMYKSGVEYIAMPGVTIIPDGTSEPGHAPSLFAEFEEEAVGQCALYGAAIIDLQNEAALSLTSSTSAIELIIECKEILDHNVTLTGGLISGLVKSINVVTDKIECHSQASFVNVGGFIFNSLYSITASEVIILNDKTFTAFNSGIYTGNAILEIRVGIIKATGYITDQPLFVVSKAILKIYNTIITTNVSTMVSQNQAGGLVLDGVRFLTSSSFGGSLPVLVISLIYLTIIKNSEIIELGTLTGRKSLGGGSDVRVYGTLTTNMPKDPLVNVFVGEFNYDTSLNSAS